MLTTCPGPSVTVPKGLVADPSVVASPCSSSPILRGWLGDGPKQTGQALGLALSLPILSSDLSPGLLHCYTLHYTIFKTSPPPNTFSDLKPPQYFTVRSLLFNLPTGAALSSCSELHVAFIIAL